MDAGCNQGSDSHHFYRPFISLLFLNLAIGGKFALQLNDLKQLTRAGEAPAVEVHSIDPSIYLIFTRGEDNRTPIKAPNGDNLIFRSRSKAFDALRDVGIARADFVHRSAFDEMVGVGDGTPTEHRESIALDSSTAAD